MLSLVAQILSLALAVVIGRFKTRSRTQIWGVAGLGALGAYLAHVVVDGQGAFLYVFLVPIIYVVCVIGRTDLDSGARL